jgi:large subunit ribosomal protein L28
LHSDFEVTLVVADLKGTILTHHVMSKVCQITGKKVMSGNNVSHSMRKTKRKFYPNLVTKRFFVAEENKFVTLKVSTAALRTINKKGISACMKEAKEKGFLQ